MKKLFGWSIVLLSIAGLAMTSCNQEVPASSLSIEKEVAIYVDSTYQLNAVLTPATATGTIHWNSSDTAVVTVSETGLLKAIQKGSAIVTANLGDAIGACNVLVRNNPVTLDLKLLDVVQKKCTVTVTPSDEEGYYYCGYAEPKDLGNVLDADLAATVLKNIQAMLAQYAAYGYNYTLKDVLQQGKKNMIASGLTASTDYVMFAFGVDIESETPSKTAARLPFKTADVVPSSMTFQIEFDSIAKVAKVSKGDTTYTYKGYFKCTPSNDTEKYVFNGLTAQVLDSVYGNDVMKCLAEMEAYYDKNYSSYGGFEGTMVKAGARDVYFSNMVHGTKYVVFAAGYDGGFTTQATTFEYTFQHPDSTKNMVPVRRVSVVDKADEIDMRDFRGCYFPGVCH